MKIRVLIIIALIIAIFLLVAAVYPTMNYRTWGNNELSYTPFSPGTKIVCNEWLWQPPQNCRSEYIITDTESEKEGVCDPGPVLEDGDCYKDGKKFMFKSETESNELECLRLYKGIREISRTDGMALAERKTIDMHKSLVFEYVEKSCPDFPDLAFMYDNYKQNIPESEFYQETKDHLSAINSKNKWVNPELEPKQESGMTFDYVIESDNVTYGSQYQITGGSVDEITYDANPNSLIISFNESEKGYLQIVIQIGLLHSLDQLPFTYFVIADGEEVVFEQLSPIVLKIPFEKGTRIIEIIGTRW